MAEAKVDEKNKKGKKVPLDQQRKQVAEKYAGGTQADVPSPWGERGGAEEKKAREYGDHAGKISFKPSQGTMTPEEPHTWTPEGASAKEQSRVQGLRDNPPKDLLEDDTAALDDTSFVDRGLASIDKERDDRRQALRDRIAQSQFASRLSPQPQQGGGPTGYPGKGEGDPTLSMDKGGGRDPYEYRYEDGAYRIVGVNLDQLPPEKRAAAQSAVGVRIMPGTGGFDTLEARRGGGAPQAGPQDTPDLSLPEGVEGPQGPGDYPSDAPVPDTGESEDPYPYGQSEDPYPYGQSELDARDVPTSNTGLTNIEKAFTAGLGTVGAGVGAQAVLKKAFPLSGDTPPAKGTPTKGTPTEGTSATEQHHRSPTRLTGPHRPPPDEAFVDVGPAENLNKARIQAANPFVDVGSTAAGTMRAEGLDKARIQAANRAVAGVEDRPPGRAPQPEVRGGLDDPLRRRPVPEGIPDRPPGRAPQPRVLSKDDPLRRRPVPEGIPDRPTPGPAPEIPPPRGGGDTIVPSDGGDTIVPSDGGDTIVPSDGGDAVRVRRKIAAGGMGLGGFGSAAAARAGAAVLGAAGAGAGVGLMAPEMAPGTVGTLAAGEGLAPEGWPDPLKLLPPAALPQLVHTYYGGTGLLDSEDGTKAAVAGSAYFWGLVQGANTPKGAVETARESAYQALKQYTEKNYPDQIPHIPTYAQWLGAGGAADAEAASKLAEVPPEDSGTLGIQPRTPPAFGDKANPLHPQQIEEVDAPTSRPNDSNKIGQYLDGVAQRALDSSVDEESPPDLPSGWGGPEQPALTPQFDGFIRGGNPNWRADAPREGTINDLQTGQSYDVLPNTGGTLLLGLDGTPYRRDPATGTPIGITPAEAERSYIWADLQATYPGMDEERLRAMAQELGGNPGDTLRRLHATFEQRRGDREFSAGPSTSNESHYQPLTRLPREG